MNGKHFESDCRNAPINPPLRTYDMYSREYKNSKGKSSDVNNQTFTIQSNNDQQPITQEKNG